jgi:hypothetical protein
LAASLDCCPDPPVSGRSFLERRRGVRARSERRLQRIAGRDRLLADVPIHTVGEERLHIDYVLLLEKTVLSWIFGRPSLGSAVRRASVGRRFTIGAGRPVPDNPLFTFHAIGVLGAHS